MAHFMFLINIDTAQLTPVYIEEFRICKNSMPGTHCGCTAFPNLYFQAYTFVATFNYVKEMFFFTGLF